jgi:C4-dicarboxylate-specific signal transduction histidine kinase
MVALKQVVNAADAGRLSKAAPLLLLAAPAAGGTDEVRRLRLALAASEAARRDAEERAHDSLAELARAARLVSLGAFAASVAHEVNQPMAAIRANGEAALRWLAKGEPNLAEARAALQRLVRDAERASAVVGRTRGMLTKRLGDRRELDLELLLREAAQLTQMQQKKAQVTVEIVVADALPAAWGDAVQVQQVLVNLITNAIDAMKTVAGRRRRLRLEAGFADDGELLISVADTGVGVAPDQAQRVFEHLFTTKPDGVGLGLPICKSIVEAHGGRMAVRANAPFGAVFSFTLSPAAVAERAAG